MFIAGLVLFISGAAIFAWLRLLAREDRRRAESLTPAEFGEILYRANEIRRLRDPSIMAAGVWMAAPEWARGRITPEQREYLRMMGITLTDGR